MGSIGETMARSLRISNRKLRRHSDWRPIYPSLREGWPATIAALPPRLQELLGYNICPPFIGYVDGRHPGKLLAAPAAG